MKNKGISICVSSAKGGVGKTITTLNLAGILEILNKKVLIIDFDLTGGGISAALNLQSQKSVYTLVDDYNNNRYKDFKNYVSSYDSYIDVLASPKDPRQASKIDAKYVELILDKAVFNYDVVLIDTNHNLNEFNISMMDKVDEILFVLTNDVQDLKNMRNLLAVFKDVGLDYYKVLLNNSRDPFKKYFSMYDMKNILKNNIDYTLSSDLFIKNLDLYTLEGKIVTLDPKMPNVFNKDYVTLMTIASEFLEKKEVK